MMTKIFEFICNQNGIHCRGNIIYCIFCRVYSYVDISITLSYRSGVLRPIGYGSSFTVYRIHLLYIAILPNHNYFVYLYADV